MKLRDLKVKAGTSAEVVCMVMREEGLLDADPRDYVVLSGCSLLTMFGEYWVTSRLDGRDVDPQNVEGDGAIEGSSGRTLTHRRDLWRILGAEEARRFWRHGHRRRC